MIQTSYNRDRHKGREDANPPFVLLEDALGAPFCHNGWGKKEKRGSLVKRERERE